MTIDVNKWKQYKDYIEKKNKEFIEIYVKAEKDRYELHKKIVKSLNMYDKPIFEHTTSPKLQETSVAGYYDWLSEQR